MAAVTVCALCQAQAAQVIVTITGTVTSGSVLGVGNKAAVPVFGFPPGTNLADKSYTLVYTIDDTLGCALYAPGDDSFIEFSSTPCVPPTAENAGNPVTSAMLTIGGGSVSFGNQSYSVINGSGATRQTNYYASFGLGENYNVVDNSGGGDVYANVYFVQPPYPAGYDWRSTLFYMPGTSDVRTGVSAFYSHVTYDPDTGAQVSNESVGSMEMTISSIKVGGLLSSAATAAARADFFSKISNACNAAVITFDSLGGLNKARQSVQEDETVKILAKVLSGNDQIFGQSIEESVGLLRFLKKIFLKRAERDRGPQVLFDACSLIFAALAIQQQLEANDPPDPNYTTVQRPKKLSFPPTGNATVDSVLEDYLTYISLEAAVLHAAERWLVANLAGDTASETLQLNAFNMYLPRATNAAASLPGDNLALSGVLPSIDVNSFPGGAAAIATAFNAQCGKSLNPFFTGLLVTLGLSQGTIGQLSCDVVGSITADDINTNVGELLATPLP